jgi:hypothetical protein
MEFPATNIQLDDVSNFLAANPESEVAGHSDNPAGHHEFSLPRADGGKDAWLFLAACFTVEALVWGELSLSKLLSQPP